MFISVCEGDSQPATVYFAAGKARLLDPSCEIHPSTRWEPFMMVTMTHTSESVFHSRT